MSLHPQTPWTQEVWRERLAALRQEAYGRVIRAKGIVPAAGGERLQVDFTPGQLSLRPWTGEGESVLTVIGTRLCREEITALFQPQ